MEQPILRLFGPAGLESAGVCKTIATNPNTIGYAGVSPNHHGVLASLHPLCVVPSEFSLHTRVLLALHRIEFLQVHLSPDSTSLFRIQVFHKAPEHHIPLSKYTNGRSLTTRPQWKNAAARNRKRNQNRTPVMTVSRTFAELVALRDDLFQLARNGHAMKPCAFCLGVICYGGYGRARPHHSMVWLHRTEKMCDKLTLFLTDLLELVLKAKTFHSDDCDGQQRIPLVFYRFLQQPRPLVAASQLRDAPDIH